MRRFVALLPFRNPTREDLLLCEMWMWMMMMMVCVETIDRCFLVRFLMVHTKRYNPNTTYYENPKLVCEFGVENQRQNARNYSVSATICHVGCVICICDQTKWPRSVVCNSKRPFRCRHQHQTTTTRTHIFLWWICMSLLSLSDECLSDSWKNYRYINPLSTSARRVNKHFRKPLRDAIPSSKKERPKILSMCRCRQSCCHRHSSSSSSSFPPFVLSCCKCKKRRATCWDGCFFTWHVCFSVCTASRKDTEMHPSSTRRLLTLIPA